MSEAVIEFKRNEETFEINERDGHYNFEIDCPWSGDSETGFGRYLCFALSQREARQLADWIYTRMPHPNPWNLNAQFTLQETDDGPFR